MSMEFSYTMFKGWFEAGGQDSGVLLAGMTPQQKLLLLSDGSMTLGLEGLLGSRVEVELRHRGNTLLGAGDASYLGEAAGKESMEREVWLTIDGKRLIYAQTLIPLDRIDKSLLNILNERGGEPLGRVLHTGHVPFIKENLEIALVRCAGAALGLGLGADALFIARRYILFNKKESGGWVIKASVTEVFSPEIISAPLLEG